MSSFLKNRMECFFLIPTNLSWTSSFDFLHMTFDGEKWNDAGGSSERRRNLALFGPLQTARHYCLSASLSCQWLSWWDPLDCQDRPGSQQWYSRQSRASSSQIAQIDESHCRFQSNQRYDCLANCTKGFPQWQPSSDGLLQATCNWTLQWTPWRTMRLQNWKRRLRSLLAYDERTRRQLLVEKSKIAWCTTTHTDRKITHGRFKLDALWANSTRNLATCTSSIFNWRHCLQHPTNKRILQRLPVLLSKLHGTAYSLSLTLTVLMTKRQWVSGSTKFERNPKTIAATPKKAWEKQSLGSDALSMTKRLRPCWKSTIPLLRTMVIRNQEHHFGSRMAPSHSCLLQEVVPTCRVSRILLDIRSSWTWSLKVSTHTSEAHPTGRKHQKHGSIRKVCPLEDCTRSREPGQTPKPKYSHSCASSSRWTVETWCVQKESQVSPKVWNVTCSHSLWSLASRSMVSWEEGKHPATNNKRYFEVQGTWRFYIMRTSSDRRAADVKLSYLASSTYDEYSQYLGT